MNLQCEEKFLELYKKAPKEVAFCPYRVNPVGAHSDYNQGFVTGMTLDRGIHIAYCPKLNGVVELCSLQFDKRAQWHVAQVPKEKRNDWADYLRGATLLLSNRYPLHNGISGVIQGTLPIGGLSSSAAVVLSFLKALCDVNDIHPSEQELIALSVGVENEYIGFNCGKNDPSCEVLSRQGRLLFLDTQTDEHQLVPFGEYTSLPFRIAIFFSGIERKIAGSNKFNMRVDESRSAAYALKAYAGMEYGKFAETNLREVPREVYEQYKDRLPDNWRKRAEHWYTEQDRVLQGIDAWRKADIQTFGRMMFESGHSSIYNWETGSEELKALYDIMSHTDGIYGGRFSGAGLKGCCMALIDPAYADEINCKVEQEYLSLFPDLKGKYQFFVCNSADGIK